MLSSQLKMTLVSCVALSENESECKLFECELGKVDVVKFQV